MGGIHAIEHALISMFPLFAVCDRNDIGGICYPFHPQVEKGAIFVYDGYPGGIGLAARGYEIILPLIEKTRELIASCACSEGCPACIHSPKCGAGNKPLDKEAAQVLLQYLSGEKGLADPVESPASPRRRARPIPSRPRARSRIFASAFSTSRPASSRTRSGLAETRTSCGFPLPSCTRRPPALPACTGGAGTGPDRGPQKAGPHCRVQHLKFDYRVLSAYTPFKLDLLPTFDMLQEIYRGLGFRVGLGHLGEKTLGRPKEGDGLQAVRWFRSGDWDNLIHYCEADVLLTRDLFHHALEKGYLVYADKKGRVLRIPTPWKIEDLIPASKA